jgi:hypothetical protein
MESFNIEYTATYDPTKGEWSTRPVESTEVEDLNPESFVGTHASLIGARQNLYEKLADWLHPSTLCLIDSVTGEWFDPDRIGTGFIFKEPEESPAYAVFPEEYEAQAVLPPFTASLPKAEPVIEPLPKVVLPEPVNALRLQPKTTAILAGLYGLISVLFLVAGWFGLFGVKDYDGVLIDGITGAITYWAIWSGVVAWTVIVWHASKVHEAARSSR